MRTASGSLSCREGSVGRGGKKERKVGEENGEEEVSEDSGPNLYGSKWLAREDMAARALAGHPSSTCSMK